MSAHRCGGGVGMLSAPGAHDWCGGIKARGNGAAGVCSASAAGVWRPKRGTTGSCAAAACIFVCTHHEIREESRKAQASVEC